MTTCAICTALTADCVYDPDVEARVCGRCRTEPARERRGPDAQRTYGTRIDLRAAVNRGAANVLGTGPLGVGEANQQALAMANARSLSPGHVLIRVARVGPHREIRDQRAAWLTLRNKPWFRSVQPLGSDARWFLFERPVAKVQREQADLRAELEKLLEVK